LYTLATEKVKNSLCGCIDMGWIRNLFSKGGTDSVTAIGNTLDALFTSTEEKAQAAAIMAKIKQQPAILQAELNKLEAQHRSVFVAGWRPAIGWVCAMSLLVYFVPQFIIASVVWVKIIAEAGWTELPPYPADPSALFELVIAMLGMGALRTVEKMSGNTK
jgi:hypothetical protein